MGKDLRLPVRSLIGLLILVTPIAAVAQGAVFDGGPRIAITSLRESSEIGDSASRFVEGALRAGVATRARVLRASTVENVMRMGYSKEDRSRGLSADELRKLLSLIRADWLIDLSARKAADGIAISAIAMRKDTPGQEQSPPRPLPAARGYQLAAAAAELADRIAADTVLIPPAERR